MKLKKLLDLVEFTDTPKIVKKSKVKWNAWVELFSFYNEDRDYPVDMNLVFNYAKVYMKALNYIHE
jgi:hypothetical protein